MIVINFSHPLIPEHLGAIESMTGQKVDELVELPQMQFDNDQPFLPQVQALLSQMSVPVHRLESEPLLIVPPSLNFIAALLLAELHGRIGYFPSVVRIRPVKDSLPPRFEVAEILNLQAIREEARKKRQD